MDPYAAQTYAPPPSSQIQPPTQDPYLFNQQYNQTPQYPYYPQQQQYPNPTNAVYQDQQEPAPIHPPGVPVQAEATHGAGYSYEHGYGYGQTHVPNSYYSQQQQQTQLGYSDPGLVQQGQQWQQQQQQGNTGASGLIPLYSSNAQPQYSGSAQSQYGSSGRGGGRPLRGGGSSFRGRGRGRGRGGHSSAGKAGPPQMAWCELCRVDCNTLEILENHKNGKKHKKNLKIQEELQKLAVKTQEAQMAAPEKVETSSSQALTDGTKVENQPAESEEQGHGLKRKTRDGSRRPVELSKKPKEIVPFICELCNVKCESAPTFDSHLKGKKHAFNLQRFQEQQATLGQAALEALYPALQALYPALLQALSQPNNAIASTSSVNGGLDQQVLQWLQAFLPQPGLSVAPQAQQSAPLPALDAHAQAQQSFSIEGLNSGGAQEAPTAGAQNQVGPENKIEELEPTTENQVEPESKKEELESKIENQVEPESNIKELDLKTAESTD